MLKSMYPSVPGEMKNSIRPKKLAAGDGDWSVSKEIILWIINTSTGTHTLSPKCITNLNQLLNTPLLTSDILQEVRAHPREAQVYVPRYSRAHWSFLPHSHGPHQSESSDGLPINYISSRHRALATPIHTDEAPPNQLCGNCPTATNIFGIHRCVRLRWGRGLVGHQQKRHTLRVAPPMTTWHLSQSYQLGQSQGADHQLGPGFIYIGPT